MKNKIYTVISCFIICTLLLMTPCFAVEIDAKNRVNEKTSDYGDGAIIYGSTRFDPLKLITADDAFDAGVNESRLTIALGKSLSDIKPVTPYYFNGASWYEITKDEEEPVKPITDKDDIAKIENNLNIFFVDNVEKTIEVKYEGDVDKNSLPSNVKYDEEKGIFVVTATTFNFTFEDSNGVETKVNTNVDTNLELEAGEEPEKAEIKRNPEVTFKLAEEIVAGEATEFTVSTVANDYEGVMVVGTGSVKPDNVLKLEYAVGDLWIEMTGESLFGNDGAGFPLQNATSKFRVTFDKAGKYDVTFAIKNLETGKIMADVATTTNVTTTKNVNTLEELETALLNNYITNINILSDIETDHSILVGRKVTINGNNKTISFKEMPKEWITDGNNYVLKVYNTEATISDIKLTNSLAGLWVGSSKVTLAGEIDVTGNKMGGIDVSKSSNEGMPNSTLTVNGTIKRDDEAIDKPIMWLENEQASLVDTNKLFVANTNIPGAFALNQTYYYSSADVYKNVEVSTAEELETAMLLSDVENIKLLNNIELINGLVVTKKVTLDFNGKEITVAEDLADISAILVLEGGDLVITGNGTLNAASQGNNYSIAVWAKETGKATIKNGTFTNVGAKSVTDAGGSCNNEMIYVSGSGVITIEDGTFTGNTENEKWGTHYTLNAHDASYKAGTAKIIVKGGTYTKFNPEKSDSENPRANFLAEGYKAVKDGDNYKVVAYDANNVTCEAELRALIAEGKSVKLAADIELSKQIVVTKALTLDFNGKTITVAENLEDISAILVLTGGDLVITGNGTLDAASQGNNYSIAVWAKETGNVTIKNGTFTNVGAKSVTDAGGSCNNEMIYVSGSGVITIEDGTFTGNTENEKWGTHYTLNAHDASYKAGTAKIIVKGGTYTKFNPEKSDSENPRANFLAEGYKVVPDGDNYKVVAE